MINLQSAMRIAENEMPDLEIKECTDIGNQFAFGFGLKKSDEIPPGTPIICVDKETGKVSEMTIPPLENLDLLSAGTIIPVPHG